MIRTTREAILDQIAGHAPHYSIPIRILIDLTTLKKRGKFWHLSTPTEDPNAPDPWVRMRWGKHGLHLVVLYLVVGDWRVGWSFRVWRGKGHPRKSAIGVQVVSNGTQVLSQRQNRAGAGGYGIWHDRISIGQCVSALGDL